MQALESYYYPSNIGLHTVREERGRGREGRGGGGEEGEGNRGMDFFGCPVKFISKYKLFSSSLLQRKLLKFLVCLTNKFVLRLKR